MKHQQPTSIDHNNVADYANLENLSLQMVNAILKH